MKFLALALALVAAASAKDIRFHIQLPKGMAPPDALESGFCEGSPTPGTIDIAKVTPFPILAADGETVTIEVQITLNEEIAAGAICSLASNHADNQVAIAQAGGIPPLVSLLSGDLTDGILCDIGMPVIHKNVRYNCRVFILDRKMLHIRPKICMADDGNYRETRWFTEWNAGELDSYLMEITSQIFHKRDDKTGQYQIGRAHV